MKTLTLDAPWTYRTAIETIDFPAGKHKVRADIAEAHERETSDGHRTAAPSAPGGAAAPEG
jgi:hypothetical protein